MGKSYQFPVIQWFFKWENVIFFSSNETYDFYEMDKNTQLLLLFKNLPWAYFYLNSEKKNDFSLLYYAIYLKYYMML